MVVSAVRAFREVEVVVASAAVAPFLRKIGRALEFAFFETAFGCKEFNLAARLAVPDFKLKRARNEVRKIAEQPACFAELNPFGTYTYHLAAAAKALIISCHYSFTVTFSIFLTR